jgi:hypothetical protein
MGRIKRRAVIAALLLMTTCGGAGAAGVSLFDSSLGTVPSTQGALFFAGIGGTQTVSPAGVDLDTTGLGNAGQIGYSNSTALGLDRATGVNLSFELQVNLESHAGTDRSGFTVIVITNDLSGIELEFWQDEVWAQNVGFTHAEGTAFDTTAVLTEYSLEILGSDYSLLAAGAPLLSGPLRDYSAFGLPYDIANFLFLGDNSSSARAMVTLGDISLTTAFVPLPPSSGLLAAAYLALVARGRRHPAIT